MQILLISEDEKVICGIHFDSGQTWELIRVSSPEVDWSKGLWFKFATPKFSFIAWSAAHNRLTVNG